MNNDFCVQQLQCAATQLDFNTRGSLMDEVGGIQRSHQGAGFSTQRLSGD